MIGSRGHDVLCDTDAKTLAQKMAEIGLNGVQLVPHKSFKGVSGKERIFSSGYARNIGKEFSKNGIDIAMLGSYFNMLEKDEVILKNDMDRFKEYLKFGKYFGCYLVGTETGSHMANWTYHPDNHGEEAYQRVVALFKELIAVAQKHGMFVGIEGAYNHTIGTPQRMKRLVDELDSENVLVILDPINYLNSDNWMNVKEIIQQSFELFGDRITLLHCKDFIVEDGKIKQVALGRGEMDYPFVKTLIDQYRPELDLMIEGPTGSDLIESISYLRDKVGFR